MSKFIKLTGRGDSSASGTNTPTWINATCIEAVLPTPPGIGREGKEGTNIFMAGGDEPFEVMETPAEVMRLVTIAGNSEVQWMAAAVERLRELDKSVNFISEVLQYD